MLKGCTKKVIFVRLAESALFEEAFFVVRAGATPIYKEGDFLSEAKKIISKSSSVEVTSTGTKKAGFAVKLLKNAAWFVAGGGAALLASYGIRFIA